MVHLTNMPLIFSLILDFSFALLSIASPGDCQGIHHQAGVDHLQILEACSPEYRKCSTGLCFAGPPGVSSMLGKTSTADLCDDS